jgi:FkbM family methyltransferase
MLTDNNLTPDQFNKMHSLLFKTAHEQEQYMKYYTPKKGDIVFDAGAHVGIYTRQFSKLVGDTGVVYAIEPDYRAIGLLTLNTEDCNNIIILPYALWNEDTIISFSLLIKNIGMSSCVVEYRPDMSEKYPVYAKKFDTIVKELELEDDTIDFIKMDIEASEIRSLWGMVDSFKQINNLAIAAYHRIEPLNRAEDAPRTYPEVERLLKDAGYKTKVETGLDGEIVYANR